MIRIVVAAAACATVLIAGCGKRTTDPRAEVKLVIVERARIHNSPRDAKLYAAVVKPRVEAVQSFRVGGRIQTRLVDVGDVVRSGEVLARLDAADWVLNAQALQGQLRAAVAQRDSASADLARFTKLTAQRLMSLAELDRQQHAVSAANAQVAALRAAAAEADNKLAYAQLRADADGVVTQVLAEAGQVVGEGTPVLIVARSAAREVEFSVPEQRRASLKTGQPVQVSLWSEPDTWMEGRVRWIAPTADAVTRAFPVRAFLIAPPGTLDLGVTATVRVTPPDDAQSQISLPIASVFDNHGASSVWIFDQKAGTLRQVPVKITGVSGNRYLIGGGVQPGDLVVTAGVHRLSVHDRVALFTGGERATDLANR